MWGEVGGVCIALLFKFKRQRHARPLFYMIVALGCFKCVSLAKMSGKSEVGAHHRDLSAGWLVRHESSLGLPF